ncbi:MAG: metallophosphoesterase family protein [Polyangiaceae bacterium]
MLVTACSGKHSASSPPTDAGEDGNAVDDAEAGGLSLTYAPQGCAYTYTPPAVLDFTGLALDDTGPVDMTNGAPQRVRLGLGGNTTKGQPGYADPTTTAAFTWETTEYDHAAKVMLGTSPGALSEVHTGYVWVETSFGGTVSNMHEVHVCGLTPGTTYFYQVGGGPTGAEVWSATQSFTTVAATGPLTIGVFGDARDTVATWQAVAVRMRNAAVDMQLVGGDIVDVGAIESLYVTWLDAIWHDPNNPAAFLTLGQVMMVPVGGNHENDAPDFFSNYAMPGNGAYAETYGSFDVGNTHFLLLDDQQIGESLEGGGTASAEATAQLAWVAQDLTAANADRTAHPFIVALAHRCMFSSSTHGTDPDVLAARGVLVPLYDQYAVDLVINGHDHDYERSKPLMAGTPPSGAPVVGTGTTYVVSAGAGADAYPTGTPQPFTQTSVAYGSGTSYIGSYSILTLDGSSLKLTAYGLKASSTTVADDDVIDTFTLTH